MARNFVSANTTDRVEVGNPAAVDITGTQLTIACWFMLAVASGAQFKLVSKWSSLVWQYLLGVSGNALIGATWDSTNFGIVNGGTGLSANVWYHAVLRKNGSTDLKVFLNGVQDGTNATANTLTASSVPLILGNSGLSGGGENPHDGRLAEVGIWDVALTTDEILSLSTGILPDRIRRESLKGYWPLNGIDSPEPDYSGSRNDGTVTGATKANHAPVGGFQFLYTKQTFIPTNPQIARPASDVSAGSWTTTPLWSKTDEDTIDDTEAIQSALNP